MLGFKGEGFGGKYGTRLKSSVRFPELDCLILDFGQLRLNMGKEERMGSEEVVDEGFDVSLVISSSSYSFYSTVFDASWRGVQAAGANEVQAHGLIKLVGCERKPSYLAISGLRHEGTIEALKKRVLKKGGRFVDLDSEEEFAGT